MNDCVRLMTQKVQEIKCAEFKLKKEKEEVNKIKENELFTGDRVKQINIFNGIFDNIKELFEAKCKIPLSTLSDAEILEKARCKKS